MIVQNVSHPPVVLAIGGFDPSSGAGISADLKTLAAQGCFGVAAITALTVQNTQGVRAVHAVESKILKESALSLLSDGEVKAIKIGMLANSDNVRTVGEILREHASIPVVLDPVIRSSSGAELLEKGGVSVLLAEILRRVRIVTPNLDEASALTGLKVSSVEEMKAAAEKLVAMGAPAVVVTGGHLKSVADVFHDGSSVETMVGDRVKPDNTHGTGCTYASALAAHLALSRSLREAVVLAKAYVTEAIRRAYPVGPGRVPLNHLYRFPALPETLD